MAQHCSCFRRLVRLSTVRRRLTISLPPSGGSALLMRDVGRRARTGLRPGGSVRAPPGTTACRPATPRSLRCRSAPCSGPCPCGARAGLPPPPCGPRVRGQRGEGVVARGAPPPPPPRAPHSLKIQRMREAASGRCPAPRGTPPGGSVPPTLRRAWESFGGVCDALA